MIDISYCDNVTVELLEQAGGDIQIRNGDQTPDNTITIAVNEQLRLAETPFCGDVP